MASFTAKYSSIIRIGWPVFVTSVGYKVFSLVEILLIGRLGSNAIAAIGLAATVFWFIVVPINGFIDSSLVFFARSLAKTDQGALNGYFWTFIAIAFATSLGSLALYFPLVLVLDYSLSGNPLLKEAKLYLFITLSSLLFYTVGRLFNFFLIATQNNRYEPVFAIFSLILNIAMSYALMFGIWPAPAMGLIGAAWGTFIARLLYVLMIMGYAIYADSRLPKLHGIRNVSSSYFDDIVKIGKPLAENNLFGQSAWTIFTMMVSQLGSVPMAAHSITTRIKDFTLTAGQSISIATTSLVSEASVNGNMEKIKEYAKNSHIFLTIIMMGIGLLFLFSPRHLLMRFSSDQQVVQVGSKLLIIMAIYQLLDAFSISYRSALIGLGDTAFVRWVGIGSGWFIMLPLVYLATNNFHLGVYGAWICFAISIFIGAWISYARFRILTGQKNMPQHKLVSRIIRLISSSTEVIDKS